MPATYEPIATTTLASPATIFSLTSIPNTYTDLRVVIVAANNSAGLDSLYITLNSDTLSSSSLYSETRLLGNGSSVAASRSTSGSIWGNASINLTPSPKFMHGTLDIFSYASSLYKSALGTYSVDNNGSGNVYRYSHLYNSTAAITAINFRCGGSGNSFVAGTTATLYGILKA